MEQVDLGIEVDRLAVSKGRRSVTHLWLTAGGTHGCTRLSRQTLRVVGFVAVYSKCCEVEVEVAVERNGQDAVRMEDRSSYV